MRVIRASSLICALVLINLAGLSGVVLPQSATDTKPATKLVKFSLIATDEQHKSVDDLQQEDIVVTEGGQPRTITYFNKHTGPVFYTIAIDTSGSFRLLLRNTLVGVKSIIENKQPNHEVMLVRFVSSDKIDTLIPFTSEKLTLLNVGIDQFTPEGGQSAVIDATYVSVTATAKHKSNEPDARRAVILVSDGEDRVSFYKRSALFKLLREQDVQVFVIGVVSELGRDPRFARPSARAEAEELLKKMAEESGGRVFFPNKQQELAEAANQIVHDLHSQYVVGFETVMAPGDKGFKKFSVKISPNSKRGKVNLITRPGYWLTPPVPDQKKPEKS
jgi:Ca-activated chloride channel family protein